MPPIIVNGAPANFAIVDKFARKHTVCHLPYYLKREHNRSIEHELLISQPRT